MPRKNRQLRPKNARSGTGLSANGHKRWRDFRTARKFATVHLKFRLIRGIPADMSCDDFKARASSPAPSPLRGGPAGFDAVCKRGVRHPGMRNSALS
jgi:hypothetical protein